MARRRKQRVNQGAFRRGPDPRRHAFTAEECRRGYRAAMKKLWLNEETPPLWLLWNAKAARRRKQP